MGRVEENSHLKFKPDMAMKVNAIECANVKFLEDISRSLAVIADSMDKDNDDGITEAELYVRDHILIEWCMENLSVGGNIEDTYEQWQSWLKECRR